jgi:hypothetical protein
LAERPIRILIVEDEMLVAMNIEDMLLELGHEVAGIAGRIGPALSLAREGSFDAAMLETPLSRSPTSSSSAESRSCSPPATGSTESFPNIEAAPCSRSRSGPPISPGRSRRSPPKRSGGLDRTPARPLDAAPIGEL